MSGSGALRRTSRKAIAINGAADTRLLCRVHSLRSLRASARLGALRNPKFRNPTYFLEFVVRPQPSSKTMTIENYVIHSEGFLE